MLLGEWGPHKQGPKRGHPP